MPVAKLRHTDTQECWCGPKVYIACTCFGSAREGCARCADSDLRGAIQIDNRATALPGQLYLADDTKLYVVHQRIQQGRLPVIT